MSVNLLSAIICLAPLTGGYVFLLGLVLYVLLMEKDEWLRKSAIKTLVVTFVFGVVSALINFVPNVIDVFDSIFRIFDKNFYIPYLQSILNVLSNIVYVLRVLILLAMSLMAFSQKSPEFKPVDDLMEKHVDLSEED